jgi:hypothetical protein
MKIKVTFRGLLNLGKIATGDHVILIIGPGVSFSKVLLFYQIIDS